MTPLPLPGLHHVTAIAGAAQANVDFFAGLLGRHLVKRTVNFDDPGTYHLYYGDAAGSPGTLLTFFPYAGATPGRAGPGMPSAYAYAVPPAAFADLADRLGALAARPVETRFGERVLTLADPDGAPVELVESAGAADAQGFHSVTLWQRDPGPTARLLTEVFGYEVAGEERSPGAERLRLVAPGGARGAIVDLWRSDRASPGRPGAGTIHHVAFRARSDAEQLAWKDRLLTAGHRTTPVTDRQYFNAIYFREPGGVLFEIATDPPGFAVDEAPDALGRRLMLPRQHERLRPELERILPALRVPA
jgi:glyoxalase family protein